MRKIREILVPDQLKSAVTVPSRCEPVIQRTYEEMARHYGTVVIPARPRSPKDKAEAESGVQVAERWILARLRKEDFFFRPAIGRRVRDLLEELNDRPMKRYGKSRRELYELVDRPALKPLPPDPFVFAELSFEERLGLLVDIQWTHQQNRRLERRLREAKLRIPGACLEDIDFQAGRGLDRALFRELALCRWVDDHLNFLITGKTGVGKSYVASALANQACRKGHRAIAYRAPLLFEEMTLARADGSYKRFLKNLARWRVLVLEDFGLVPMTERARFDLLEVLEDRYAARSTIVTSQLPPEAWHEWIGDDTVADAILDRLVHNAYRIPLDGPSRRKRDGGTG